MPNERSRKEFRLGFLTAIHVPERGHVGGLLVTNQYARPLEFQCTTPVQPNRRQEILYGPTLVPYILSDLIGKTLIEKVGVKPQLVLVDRPELLELRAEIGIPVAYVTARVPEPEPASANRTSPDDETQPSVPLGQNLLQFDGHYQQDRAALEECRKVLAESADLLEPFRRVHEALKEVSTPVPNRAVPA